MFHRLPDPIFLEILTYLDQVDMANLRQTSKEFSTCPPLQKQMAKIEKWAKCRAPLYKIFLPYPHYCAIFRDRKIVAIFEDYDGNLCDLLPKIKDIVEPSIQRGDVIKIYPKPIMDRLIFEGSLQKPIFQNYISEFTPLDKLTKGEKHTSFHWLEFNSNYWQGWDNTQVPLIFDFQIQESDIRVNLYHFQNNTETWYRIYFTKIVFHSELNCHLRYRFEQDIERLNPPSTLTQLRNFFITAPNPQDEIKKEFVRVWNQEVSQNQQGVFFPPVGRPFVFSASRW